MIIASPDFFRTHFHDTEQRDGRFTRDGIKNDMRRIRGEGRECAPSPSQTVHRAEKITCELRMIVSDQSNTEIDVEAVDHDGRGRIGVRLLPYVENAAIVVDG